MVKWKKEYPKGMADVVMWAINIGANAIIGVPEGKVGGALFVIGDTENVMKYSVLTRPPDPINFIPMEMRYIQSPEFIQWFYTCMDTLDGAIIVDENGTIHGTSRYLPIEFDGDYQPRGVGARHLAACTITKKTKAVSVVISSRKTLRIYYKGRLLKSMLPFVGLLPDKDDDSDDMMCADIIDEISNRILTMLCGDKIELGTRIMQMLRMRNSDVYFDNYIEIINHHDYINENVNKRG